LTAVKALKGRGRQIGSSSHSQLIDQKTSLFGGQPVELHIFLSGVLQIILEAMF